MDKRRKVPVTEQDKKKSYYKYYLEPMVEPPAENIQKVLAGPIDPAKALPVHERNRLFEPGYLKRKLVIVLCRMERLHYKPCENAGCNR